MGLPAGRDLPRSSGDRERRHERGRSVRSSAPPSALPSARRRAIPRSEPRQAPAAGCCLAPRPGRTPPDTRAPRYSSATTSRTSSACSQRATRSRGHPGHIEEARRQRLRPASSASPDAVALRSTRQATCCLPVRRLPLRPTLTPEGTTPSADRVVPFGKRRETPASPAPRHGARPYARPEVAGRGLTIDNRHAHARSHMRTYYDIHLNDRSDPRAHAGGRGDRQGGPLPDREDAARAGGGERRSALAREPADLFRRPVCRIELLERQPHQRRDARAPSRAA